MKNFSLIKAIFLSIFVGILSGYLINTNVTQFSILLSVANFFSTIFLRLLKMIIIPLVFTSIVSGLLSAGKHGSIGKLGFKTLSYYVLSSFLAIFTGLILVNIFEPGKGMDLGISQSVDLKPSSFEEILGIFIRMIPENIFASASQGQMLPVIFFSLFFGISLINSKDKIKENVGSLFSSFFEVIMDMTSFILYTAPLGIWALMTKLVATSGFSVFVPLAWYASCVLLALFIHSLVVLPLLVYVFSGKSPLLLLRHMRLALLTAFSTASSAATLPLTMRCLEKNAGVSNKVSSFVLPLGATINMDGTALYECVAVIFIAQAYGIDLSFAKQMLVVITALLASIGAAGVPMAGLVMMSVVLTAVGLPLEGVGLIIAVDRVLDMFRTSVNVWSDSCGSYIIDKYEVNDSSSKN